MLACRILKAKEEKEIMSNGNCHYRAGCAIKALVHKKTALNVFASAKMKARIHSLDHCLHRTQGIDVSDKCFHIKLATLVNLVIVVRISILRCLFCQNLLLQ